MRILMLGNSFTFTNDMPQMLADLTGAEVTHHARGGAEGASDMSLYEQHQQLKKDLDAVVEEWESVSIELEEAQG